LILATLTGAIISAWAMQCGVFSNDDTLCNAFLLGQQKRKAKGMAHAHGRGLRQALKSPHR